MNNYLEMVPKDEDGKILMFTGAEDFKFWYTNLRKYLKSIGLRAVMRDEVLDSPVRPVDALLRIDSRAAIAGDETLRKDFIKAKATWEMLCERAIAIIKRTETTSKSFLSNAWVTIILLILGQMSYVC